MEWLKVSMIFLILCVLKCSSMLPSEIEEFKNFIEQTSKLDQILVKKGAIPENDVNDDEPISDDAWEQSGKFEGDLILNERQRRLIVEDVVEGLSRNGLKDFTKRWPDNELVYYIQREHFNSDQIQAIQDGIDDLSQASCVKFRPYKKGDRDAVVIQGSRRGCFSNVGYQGGYQVMNLNGRHPPGRGCFRHGTIVHELLHSLGFYHMQSSPDRDDYINVKWENIHEPAKHNFRKYNTFSVSDFGVGYDYDSVLHYGRRAFSRNGQDTLVPKQDGVSIGQRIRLSDKDVQKLNKMYCDSDSNNDDAANAPAPKPVNKKDSPKNKPFQGHGIGYHQGKAIIIKLPAAETFKLTNTPQLLLFDHFSKAPEALPQTFAEEIGAGKQITYDYGSDPYNEPGYGSINDPYNDVKDHAYSKPNYNYDSFSTSQYEITASPEVQVEDPKHKEKHKKNGSSVLSNPKYESSSNFSNGKSSPDKSEETKRDNLDDKLGDVVDEAFDRLGKIIKTHVYPSQTPDLEVYKTKLDYSEYYNPMKYEPKPEIANIDKALGPTKVISTETENNSAEPENVSKEKDKKNSLNNVIRDSDKDTHEVYTPKKTNKKHHSPKEFDSSFGTAYPLNLMPEVNEEKFVTPDYATHKGLAHRHDYSEFYNPEEKYSHRKGKHHLFGYIVPLHDKIVDSDDFKKGDEKYDQDTYSYSPDNGYKNVTSKLIQFDRGSGKDNAFGRSPFSKKAFSLFGVLVPVTKQWYRVDYDPHSDSYSIEKPESNEDYR